jgi:hypothetical protein
MRPRGFDKNTRIFRPFHVLATPDGEISGLIIGGDFLFSRQLLILAQLLNRQSLKYNEYSCTLAQSQLGDCLVTGR